MLWWWGSLKQCFKTRENYQIILNLEKYRAVTGSSMQIGLVSVCRGCISTCRSTPALKDITIRKQTHGRCGAFASQLLVINFFSVISQSHWIAKEKNTIYLYSLVLFICNLYLLISLCCCYCCERERLCLYGTSAANGPIVHPLDDTWVNTEQRWNDIDRGKPRDSEKNLSQCHFVNHKSHMNCSGREPGPPQWEAGN
jgi:hypothetical protein